MSYVATIWNDQKQYIIMYTNLQFIVNTVEMRASLMKKELCRSLFCLFSGWCGPLAKHLGSLVPAPPPTPEVDERLNLSALKVIIKYVLVKPVYLQKHLWIVTDILLTSTSKMCGVLWALEASPGVDST